MNNIPEITDEQGQYWTAPARERIQFVGTAKTGLYAIMSQRDFDMLLEYNTTTPSGVYVGKMWKKQIGDRYALKWYYKCDNDPDCCSIKSRVIVVLN